MPGTNLRSQAPVLGALWAYVNQMSFLMHYGQHGRIVGHDLGDGSGGSCIMARCGCLPVLPSPAASYDATSLRSNSSAAAVGLSLSPSSPHQQSTPSPHAPPLTACRPQTATASRPPHSRLDYSRGRNRKILRRTTGRILPQRGRLGHRYPPFQSCASASENSMKRHLHACRHFSLPWILCRGGG